MTDHKPFSINMDRKELLDLYHEIQVVTCIVRQVINTIKTPTILPMLHQLSAMAYERIIADPQEGPEAEAAEPMEPGDDLPLHPPTYNPPPVSEEETEL